MKRLYSIIIFILFFTNILFSKTIASDKQNIKIINIINHQRMLSQQITKAYLYARNSINTDEANKEISNSLKEFKNSYQKIDFLTKNQKIKNAMYSIEESSKKFNTLSQKPLNIKNMKLILNLSESILNQSEQIISFLKNNIHNNNSKFITMLGQQKMLAQRIAKYYIAYISDKSQDNKINMKRSIELFAKNHKKIMKYKVNIPIIKDELEDIDKLWNIANNFYINIEKSGELPLSVFQTTDNITQNINNIIKIYTNKIK
ncbi:MAG: hypothetical protein KAU90_07195 [Sulfurovaceae bacterium]|nr:hypothetical protein [Sulfurovaceae bacterium]